MAEQFDDADRSFVPGPHWQEKTSWAPGMPLDGDTISDVFYEVRPDGRAASVQRATDGLTKPLREVSLETLGRLAGEPVTLAGWYNVRAEYIGAELPPLVSDVLQLHYQVEDGGRTFVQKRMKDGSTTRHPISGTDLVNVSGQRAPGWYNSLGEYLGTDAPAEAETP